MCLPAPYILNTTQFVHILPNDLQQVMLNCTAAIRIQRKQRVYVMTANGEACFN